MLSFATRSPSATFAPGLLLLLLLPYPWHALAPAPPTPILLQRQLGRKKKEKCIIFNFCYFHPCGLGLNETRPKFLQSSHLPPPSPSRPLGRLKEPTLSDITNPLLRASNNNRALSCENSQVASPSRTGVLAGWGGVGHDCDSFIEA